MKVDKKVAIAALLAVSLASCAGRGPNETGGAVLGGALGGVVGSQFGQGRGQLAMVGLGALLGAFAGSQAGKSLDKADEEYARQTAYHALEVAPAGNQQTWNNPDSGNHGTVTPTRTYQQADGTYCREFQQTIVVGGETQDAFGTACRQPDGTWKIVGSP